MNIAITGATGAIGSALATLWNARGDKLLLCGRSDEKLPRPQCVAKPHQF